jgi:hypothetical protein
MLAATAAFLFGVAVATAQPDKIYDNWNTDACGYTDRAPLDLQAPAHLQRLEVWYHWRGQESAVAYTLSRGGQTVRSGMLLRADCDPYQDAWCVARDAVDLDLGRGLYIIRTERPRVCQNAGSGGSGFVKAFGRVGRLAEEGRDMGRLAWDVWRVEEGVGGQVKFAGTWTRRGRSEIFDAVWRNLETRAEVRDTLRVIEARGRVVIYREGNKGEYRGELSSDGEHIQGTANWYPQGWFWRADARRDR